MLRFVLIFALFALSYAEEEAASQVAEIELIFPNECPNEDAEWCSAETDTAGNRCNYRRPDGSVVFKLLDNVWYNCPKHCFGCVFPGRELNITHANLVETSEILKQPPPTNSPSVELLEFWLEQRTINEAFQGPCEDAASFGESGEHDVCSKWIDEQGVTFCQAPDFQSLDRTNPRQDFSTIKLKGYWWCKQSCTYCE